MRSDYLEASSIWLTYNDPKGLCHEASLFMYLAFPELRVIRGHYGGRPHWWNLGPDGIIDLTIGQFPFISEYVAYCGEEPYGKCHECGELVFIPGSHFCCEACEEQYKQMLWNAYAG